MPASLDAAVVSDTVEDHATQAMLCVRKLGEQLELFRYLLAVEAMVAAQAVDLRQSSRLGVGTQSVFDTVRSVVAPLRQDRPPGPDAMAVRDALFSGGLYRALRAITEAGSTGKSLHGL